jgi:hypothetical protein
MPFLTATSILATLLCLLNLESPAQGFHYGINIGYGIAKYSFPVEQDWYHPADFEPLNTLNAAGSIHYAVSSSFRINSGIQYTSIKGQSKGGNIGRRLVNPNSEGSVSLDVNNSFLIFPAAFQVILLPKSFIKPSFCAGLNFFKPLDQNIVISITPRDPDPAYEEVKSEITNKTKSSYFGGRLGAGVIASVSDQHEWSLMVYRNFNKSRYEMSDAINGDFEKHEINFNMWEISLAWIFRP